MTNEDIFVRFYSLIPNPARVLKKKEKKEIWDWRKRRRKWKWRRGTRRRRSKLL